MDDERSFTQEEATRLWRRAAILQEEEAGMALRPEGVPPAAISGRLLVESAREADIGADYMNLALAESAVAGPGAPPPSAPPGFLALDGVEGAFIHRWKRLKANRAQAYGSMRQCFPERPFGLGLKASFGASGGGQGAFVFEAPDADPSWNIKSFSVKLYCAGIERIIITIAEEPGGGSVIHARAPLSRRLRSVRLQRGIISSAFTLVDAGAGAAILGGIAVGAGAAALPFTLGGAALGAFLGALGVDALVKFYFRWGMRKGIEALDELLAAVDLRLRHGGDFAPPAATPQAHAQPPIIIV